MNTRVEDNKRHPTVCVMIIDMCTCLQINRQLIEFINSFVRSFVIFSPFFIIQLDLRLNDYKFPMNYER